MLIGDLRVDPVSDGTFVARPEYFGPDLAAGARPDFFRRHGAAWLPIGCFVIRAGDRLMLVDAGLGPDRQELPHDMHLVGGQLLTGLRALGVTQPDQGTPVARTRRRSHGRGRRALPRAPVWPGAAWSGPALVFLLSCLTPAYFQIPGNRRQRPCVAFRYYRARVSFVRVARCSGG